MAKRSTRPSAPSFPPSIPPEKGIELLRRQRVKGEELLTGRPLLSSEYDAWETETRDYLVRAFGSESPNVGAVMDIGKGVILMMSSEAQLEKNRAENLGKQLRMIDSVIEILKTEIDLRSPQPQRAEPQPTGNQVFIAHGNNNAILQQVARFLEKLCLPVTILREQPNKGRTIIEKFVDYSGVAFAVVLLTADDHGGRTNAPVQELLPRARQNVILELGFFLGKLGREKVCAIYQQGVEIPSDYSGVLFVPLDEAGAWRFDLAREMKAAGLDVDMNLAI